VGRLRVSLFGGFRVECERGQRISLTHKKGQALLALLALRPGQGYSRDALTALLWSDSSDGEARHSLRQELHTLRRTLARTKTRALIVDGEHVALDAGAVEVDVVTFERLAAEGSPKALKRAAELYEGDLLLGVTVPESGFEEHLRSERERLRQRAISVLTRVLDHEAQRRLVDAAVETASRVLAIDPTQETVHRALMQLFARHGRRAAALRQYQTCVEILQRELGVEPEPATRRLYQEILRSPEPTAAPAPAARPTSRHPRRRAPAGADRLGVDPPLVGRQAELARLREALDDVGEGRGRVAVILGEAGVGKTRLVSELTSLAAEREARTLVGRAYETAQVLAFGLWADVLHAGLAATPDAVAALEPRWRVELARVLPELSTATPAPTQANPAHIFEAIVRVLDHLAARQPLVIVLEDVHWADELTLRLAAHVGRHSERRRLLLVLTAREEDIGEAPMLGVALRELRAHAGLVSLTLAPLSREDTVTLSRSLSRGEHDSVALARRDEHVWRISAGNPLLVLETLRALQERPAAEGGGPGSLPTRVRELVMARIERLSERARAVVSIASVIGRECDFRLLQHCAGFDDRVAAEVVEELVRRRVFHGVGERLDFTHDRLRAAARAALVPAQVKSLHRLIATSIEAVYAGELEQHYAPLAAHCRDGELWDPAATYLGEVGKRAADRSAHREAVVAFEQALAALAHLPESRRTLELGVDIALALHMSSYALGELTRAFRALGEAEAPARRLGDARRAALLASQTGQTLWVTGRAREALPLFEHAATVAKSIDDFALLTSATLYIGSARFSMGDLVEAEDCLRRVVHAIGATAAGEKLGLQGFPLVFAESGLTVLLAEQGRFQEAYAHGATSLRVAEALNHDYTLVFALRMLGHAQTVQGRLADAVAILERGMTLCRDGSIEALRPNIMASLGYAYVLGGRPGDGIRLLDEALATLESRQTRVWHTVVLNQLAEGWLATDEIERARDCAGQALALARDRGERAFEAAALRVAAAVASRSTPLDVDAAQARYREALALAEARTLRPLVGHCHAGLARLYEGAGDRRRAEEHRAAALATWRELGMSAS
jgi:DNA-binding SARP family transcriptional activator/tetratricopeptide (TPR) repeat protein